MSFIKNKFLIFTFLLLSSISFASSKINAADFSLRNIAKIGAGIYLSVKTLDILAEFICCEKGAFCFDSCFRKFWIFTLIIPFSILSKLVNDNRLITNML